MKKLLFTLSIILGLSNLAYSQNDSFYKEKAFWNSFSDKIVDLEDIYPIWEEVRIELKKYDSLLEFGCVSRTIDRVSTKKLIISAKGNQSKFSSVKKLVSQSPVFKDFNVIALYDKDSLSIEGEIQLDGKEYNSKTIFYSIKRKNARNRSLQIYFPENIELSKSIKKQDQLKFQIMTTIGEEQYSKFIEFEYYPYKNSNTLSKKTKPLYNIYFDENFK